MPDPRRISWALAGGAAVLAFVAGIALASRVEVGTPAAGAELRLALRSAHARLAGEEGARYERHTVRARQEDIAAEAVRRFIFAERASCELHECHAIGIHSAAQRAEARER